MSKSILLEAHAVTLKSGTGIATYARNLAKTATNAGYRTELLLGIDRPINRRDPLLAEVSLYDAHKPPANPVLAFNRAVDWTIGVPLGARASSCRPSASCSTRRQDRHSPVHSRRGQCFALRNERFCILIASDSAW